MSERSAFIFPAFVHSYPEYLFQELPDIEAIFYSLLKSAGNHLGNNLAEFNHRDCNFLENELFTQYITYSYSCSLIQYFRLKGCYPEYSAGYSMGIYAALFNAAVISFTDGLDLITNAFESIQSCAGNKKYGMAGIIGLSRTDINEQINNSGLKVEITNQNSEFAFVLSGVEIDLDIMIEKATNEGALHVRKMNTSIPYHSSILKVCSSLFSRFVDTVPFKQPENPIISLIDQQIPDTPDQLRAEVIRNLFTPLNWFHTQLILIKSGINEFVECGIDKGLIKNSKFINGDYKFFSVPDYLNKSEYGIDG